LTGFEFPVSRFPFSILGSCFESPTRGLSLMSASTVRIGLWICGAALLCSCAAMHRTAPPQPVVLANSLRELLPHSDGDHLVYIWQRRVDGRPVAAGIQVEHVSGLGGGEFEVALSEDGVATGRVLIRDDAKALLILSEDDFARGLRLSYAPPLPYLEMPLVAGERHVTATATATQLATGESVGSVQVTQTVQASATSPVHSELGTYERPVLLRTTRRLETAEGALELTTAMILAPGVGEIRSDGSASGAPAMHRELACATIGGHHLGDCRTLNVRVKELQRAGSTDVR
jgi:hypothetical protein